MFDKGFAAGIACLFCDIDHFGANARYFAQANLVDLLCRQIGGGFFADAKGVISRAIGLR